MKKTGVIGLVLAVLLLSGCAPAAQPAAPEPTDGEVALLFEERVQKWAAEQTLLETDRVTAETAADPLLMNEGDDERAYSNLTLTVAVHYFPEQLSGREKEVTDQIQTEISAALADTGYMRRVDRLVVNCYGPNDALRFWTDVGMGSPDLAAELSEEEAYVQTLVYDYVAAFGRAEFGDEQYDTSLSMPKGEVTLKRFGVRPESGELYAEIPVYRLPSSDEEERTAFKAGLKTRSEELFALLSDDERAASWLREQGVETVTVAYQTAWETQGEFFYTYTYELAPSA